MKTAFTLFLLGIIFSSYAQQKNEVVDTTSVTNLEEVLVSTGQYKKQSVDKALFEVKVITAQDIKRQGANSLADVMNQLLNINIIPNASSGRSRVKLFGLDGQYFKVLVDNIPLINDEGMGNNTDLTQINLEDIHQIEFVEGSMGVQYGANAISGIINIITKKSSHHTWEIRPYIQEETVRSEYALFDQGRHIQSLRIATNISDNIYASGSYLRNDFGGFLNDKKGYSHTKNDNLRGYSWVPKTQYSLKGTLRYHTDNFEAFYKAEYFDENLTQYGSNVMLNENTSTNTTNPTAKDKEYVSKRWYHHLNANGNLGRTKYTIAASYQEQERTEKGYTYEIRTRKKLSHTFKDPDLFKTLFSRGTFSNFIDSKSFDFELGYETSLETGAANNLSVEENDINGENIELNFFDFFASSEFFQNKKLSFRPGIRLMTSSKFSPQYAYSLSTKYTLNKGFDIRLILGSSPRLPRFYELFYYFVDVNHNVQGNQYLEPEKGKSVFLHFKKKPYKLSNIQLTHKLSPWYLDVNDRIELAIVNPQPLRLQYINIDKYKGWGVSLNNSAAYRSLSVTLGASLTGVSKVLNSQQDSDDAFLYSLQGNANIKYTIPKWNTILSAYLKYNGPEYQFVQRTNDDGDTILIRGKQNDYSWMDASIKKTFMKDTLELTLGARNLFDVTQISTSATSGGAHSTASSRVTLGYGRSYFFKVMYNLNFK